MARTCKIVDGLSAVVYYHHKCIPKFVQIILYDDHFMIQDSSPIVDNGDIPNWKHGSIVGATTESSNFSGIHVMHPID